MSRRSKFVVHQGKDGQWYVRYVAANGEIQLSSEGYTRKASAQRSAKSAQRNIAAMSTWWVGLAEQVKPRSPP